MTSKNKYSIKEINLILKKINIILQKIHNLRDNKEITVMNSLKLNYICWVYGSMAVFAVSNNYTIGMITAIIAILQAYFTHKYLHEHYNLFTVLHYYHHKYDNFFSHFIAYLYEVGYVCIFLLLNDIFGTIILDGWVILLFSLLYTSVHNINYGYLHVNTVHELHHKYPLTNIGLDICDIIFGTKHPDDITVENTNHYIPNIIISTVLILFIKQLYQNDSYKYVMNKSVYILAFACYTIGFVSSIYLYYFSDIDFTL